MFEEGKLPKSSDLVTDVAVLGMFHEESSPSKLKRQKSILQYCVLTTKHCER